MSLDAEGESALDFLFDLRERASARRRSIVFPEASDPRVLDAVAECAREGLLEPVLLGDTDTLSHELEARDSAPPDADRADLWRDRVRIVAPGDLRQPTLEHVRTRRAGRDDPEEALEEMAGDALFQAAALVATGEVDGMVAGCVRTTADVVRSGLVSVGLAPGIGTLSSSFYMVFRPGHPAGARVLTFTDAGVVPDPDPEQLAEIAAAAVDARERIVGDEPRVAFLSYSSKGSAEGRTVEKVREALRGFRSVRPAVSADGELQADAALVPAVAARKAPDSEVAGRANVLVFPDLGAANIAYKLVQYLGSAVALGPVLQGLARPMNDLSRGAVAEDIVAVSCITSLQAR